MLVKRGIETAMAQTDQSQHGEWGRELGASIIFGKIIYASRFFNKADIWSNFTRSEIPSATKN